VAGWYPLQSLKDCDQNSIPAIKSDLSISIPRHHTTAMFELRKTFAFEASHQLKHHDGKCARLHGHSYTMTIEVSGDRLQSDGPQKNMLLDFKKMSFIVKNIIITYLDHHHLNDTLKTDSPTAEFIARWLYWKLAPALPLLTAVEIRETASASATYRPSRRRSQVTENGERLHQQTDQFEASSEDEQILLDGSMQSIELNRTKCDDEDDPKSDDTNDREP